MHMGMHTAETASAEERSALTPASRAAAAVASDSLSTCSACAEGSDGACM